MRRITDNDVHMLTQDSLRVDADVRAKPRAQNRVHNYGDVMFPDSRDAPPRMPRDMRVESTSLVRSLVSHLMPFRVG